MWLGRSWKYDKSSWKWLPPACIRVAFKILYGFFLFSFLLLVWVPQFGQIGICFLDSFWSFWLAFFGSWACHKMPASRTSRKPITIWPSSGTQTRRRQSRRKRPPRNLKGTLIQAEKKENVDKNRKERFRACPC